MTLSLWCIILHHNDNNGEVQSLNIISAVSFSFSENVGRLLENTVFAGLKTRGLACYYWKGKKGCDFIVKEGKTVSEALQVSYSIKDAGTRKMEIEGLLEAMREFKLKKGTILTYRS